MKQGHNKYKHYKRKTATEKRGRYKIKSTVNLKNLDDYFTEPEKISLLKEAAKQATCRQLSQGIPIVQMEEGTIYKLHPDGRKEIIALTGKRFQRLSQKRLYIQK